MSERISRAEYARRHGVSRPAVGKWVASGHVVLAEGLVEVEASDQRLQHAGLGRFRAAGAERPPGLAVPPKAAADSGAGNWVGEPDAGFLEQVLGGQFVAECQAEGIKQNVLAAKHLLSLREAAGELVSRAAAEQLLFTLARELRDGWLNWSTRVGPVVAAALGVAPEQVIRELTRHVEAHLAQCGEPSCDWSGGDLSDQDR